MNILSAQVADAGSVDSLIRPWDASFDQYLHDESKVRGSTALGICFPKTTAEVSALLRHFGEKGQKVSISAARTGLTAGAVPSPDAYVISLEKLRGVMWGPAKGAGDQFEITVLAGTSLQELAEAVREKLPGYFFPVNPTEQSASVGGAVALNAGGSRSLRYGSMRQWVAGLRVVLADGSTLSLRRGEVRNDGGKLILRGCGAERALQAKSIQKPKTKNTIGYSFGEESDAIDLFIGSEGTLGVITEVTLALEAAPKLQLSHFQLFRSAKNALETVGLIRSSMQPLSIEFIDRRSIALVAESPRAEWKKFIELSREAEAALFFEIPANGEQELDKISEALIGAVSDLGEDPEWSLSGTGERTADEIRAFRHAVPERVNAIIAERKRAHPGLHKLALDMAVEDDSLLWLYELYERELAAGGFEFCIFGHAGNNHFHPNLLPRTVEELNRAKEIYLALASQIVARGGTVAAEHGIGRLKQRFLHLQYSEADFENFQKIRNFFDPKGQLNPGVLF